MPVNRDPRQVAEAIRFHTPFPPSPQLVRYAMQTVTLTLGHSNLASKLGLAMLGNPGRLMSLYLVWEIDRPLCSYDIRPVIKDNLTRQTRLYLSLVCLGYSMNVKSESSKSAITFCSKTDFPNTLGTPLPPRP